MPKPAQAQVAEDETEPVSFFDVLRSRNLVGLHVCLHAGCDYQGGVVEEAECGINSEGENLIANITVRLEGDEDARVKVPIPTGKFQIMKDTGCYWFPYDFASSCLIMV